MGQTTRLADIALTFVAERGVARISFQDISGSDLTFSCLMTYIYICRTAPLTSRCCILYIYSTNIRTEYFKHAAHSPLFPLENAVYFIVLPFWVPVLFTF